MPRVFDINFHQVDAAGAAVPPPAAAAGVECPTCGCRDLRVVEVRGRPGGAVRRRVVCRHCGRRMMARA
jgi:DNA-directed RNA polymerase subunit RPC12/RpoP